METAKTQPIRRFFPLGADVPPPTEDTYFKLEQCGNAVMLIACDRHGNRLICGNVLRIMPEGVIHLEESVNPDIGLQTRNFVAVVENPQG